MRRAVRADGEGDLGPVVEFLSARDERRVGHLALGQAPERVADEAAAGLALRAASSAAADSRRTRRARSGGSAARPDRARLDQPAGPRAGEALVRAERGRLDQITRCGARHEHGRAVVEPPTPSPPAARREDRERRRHPSPSSRATRDQAPFARPSRPRPAGEPARLVFRQGGGDRQVADVVARTAPAARDRAGARGTGCRPRRPGTRDRRAAARGTPGWSRRRATTSSSSARRMRAMACARSGAQTISLASIES